MELCVTPQCVHNLLLVNIILDDLKIKRDGPMRLYCDNESTINITYDLIHSQMKYIKLDYIMKENLKSGIICTSYMYVND